MKTKRRTYFLSDETELWRTFYFTYFLFCYLLFAHDKRFLDISALTNATVVTGADVLESVTSSFSGGGGCPYEYSWCHTMPQLSFWQFLIGATLVGIGYPVTAVILNTLYSKVLGPIPQVRLLYCGFSCHRHLLCSLQNDRTRQSITFLGYIDNELTFYNFYLMLLILFKVVLNLGLFHSS